MDFLTIHFLRNETLLSWTFPVIKIRFPPSDVDDSGDIRGWIRLSPIVNPFILNILFVYSIRLQVVIPWSPQAVLKTGPRVSSFYTCLLQGVYIAG